jgi:hypothetical protein
MNEVKMRSFGTITARTLVMLAAATPLAAQNAVAKSAAQAPMISQAALIAVVENHKGAVLRYIDAAPDSMLGFRPTKGVRNYAEQIEHAAGSDAFIVQLAITGSSKGIPSMGDTAVYLHNKAALKKYAAAAMDYTIARLRTVTDAQLVEQIKSNGAACARTDGTAGSFSVDAWAGGSVSATEWRHAA